MHAFFVDDRRAMNWGLLEYEEYEGDFLKEVPLTPLKNFWVKGFWGSICVDGSLSIPPWGCFFWATGEHLSTLFLPLIRPIWAVKSHQ